MDADLKALLVLNRLQALGRMRAHAYFDHGGRPSEFLTTLMRGARGGELAPFLEAWEPEREADSCARRGVNLIAWGASNYPRALLSLPDPPLVLYTQGALFPEDFYALAIVGSRHPSLYGRETSRRFARELASSGITIVSGLARGIDGDAHRGAIEGGGRTVGVLGCGLDVIYPPEHAALYRELAERGAVVTELPLGTPPEPYHFPRRNRLVSGLALGVLVVEAGDKSGSLITAELAAEQGREVFAVPGRIDSLNSRGTNRLIRQGACLVQSPEDILAELAPVLRGYLARDTQPESEAPEAGDAFLAALGQEPLSLEEITAVTRMRPEQVSSGITRLELGRKVRKLPDGRYARA
jgi:DNA processing protein